MTTKSFSIGHMLKLGWNKFKENPVTWVLALLLMTLILASHSFVNSWLLGYGFTFMPEIDRNIEIDNRTAWLLFLVSIIYMLIQMGLGLGLIYMSLRAADNLSVNIGHLFARFQYVFHYLISSILFGLIIIVGLLLLVFPAAIWAARYYFFGYFIADQGAGPIEALKLSARATDGAKWDVFAFIVTTLFLTFLGTLAFIIGLFIVIPVITIAWAHIYRHLTLATPAVTRSIEPPIPTA